MKKSEVADYVNVTRHVEGWFFPIDAVLFGLIDEIQKREGIAGNLFEIGVHHGKTALFLARMAAGAEILGVCDVFEQQELNRDQSGEGSRWLFETHMRDAAFLDPSRLRIFPAASRHLTIHDTTANCRFFHIDGGHRPGDVINDLRVADRALMETGVVAVDDVFNPSWPGVGEGFYRYLGESPDTFVPILIGGNKVLLTRPSAASLYEAHWSDPEAWSEFFEPHPFSLGFKQWLGRSVLTMIRQTWVDLDPEGAAAAHSRPHVKRTR